LNSEQLPPVDPSTLIEPLRFDLNNPPDPFSLSDLQQLTFLLGLFRDLGVQATLHVTDLQLMTFFKRVKKGYVQSNPYHSFYHAIDVTQMVHRNLVDMRAIGYLTKLDIAALMMASLCHDIGHPGLNNNFQVNAKTPVALRYNNVSVLENLSCTMTMELLHECKLVEHLEEEQFAIFQETIVQSILATDMVHHFTLLERLHAIVDSASALTPLPSPSASPMLQPERKISDPTTKTAFGSSLVVPMRTSSRPHTAPQLYMTDAAEAYPLEFRRGVCCILLHAADISNTVRPWDISKKWSDLVNEEFAHQGEEERNKGLPVSPGMDPADPRESVRLQKQSRLSIQFCEILVKPFFVGLAELLPNTQAFVETLEANVDQWKTISVETAQLAAKEAEEQAKSESNETVSHQQRLKAEKLKRIAARIAAGEEPLDALLGSSSNSNRKFSIAAGTFDIPIDWKDRLRRRTHPHGNNAGTMRISSNKAARIPPVLLPSSMTFIQEEGDETNSSHSSQDNSSDEVIVDNTLARNRIKKQVMMNPATRFRAANNVRVGSDITHLMSPHALKNVHENMAATTMSFQRETKSSSGVEESDTSTRSSPRPTSGDKAVQVKKPRPATVLLESFHWSSSEDETTTKPRERRSSSVGADSRPNVVQLQPLTPKQDTEEEDDDVLTDPQVSDRELDDSSDDITPARRRPSFSRISTAPATH
jgi:hypothetical protein